MTHENTVLESCKALMAQDERRENKRLAKLMEQTNARKAFKDNYYRLAESRESERAEHEAFMEAARDDAFSTALKAIYLTAIEAATLTDQGIVLAENMVDTWIAENGGATKILGKAQNKTYFLARLSEIVEAAAIAAVKEAEDDTDPAEEEEEEEETKEEKKEEGEDDGKDEEKSDEPASDDEDKSEDDNEKSEDDEKEAEDSDAADDKADKEGDKEEAEGDESETDATEGEDSKDEPEADEVEDYSAELDVISDDEVDNDEDASEDDDVEDIVGEPLDDDGLDSDDTVDGEEDKGQLMTDLEAEPDVQKAVELIRTRVADAEETFIKNNAKDKKEIDELVGRISDSIKAVDAIKDKESREAKAAQEHVNMLQRELTELHEGAYLSDVFTNMARALNRGILKNQAVLEKYSDENGKLDTDLIVEATKIMYGFMETLNTLQLVKVDEEYIAQAIKDMEK